MKKTVLFSSSRAVKHRNIVARRQGIGLPKALSSLHTDVEQVHFAVSGHFPVTIGEKGGWAMYAGREKSAAKAHWQACLCLLIDGKTAISNNLQQERQQLRLVHQQLPLLVTEEIQKLF